MERSVWRPERTNYFFALLPGPAAAAAADRMAGGLRHWLGLSGRPCGTERYHVSLWGWPRREEPDAQELALMDRVAQRIRQRSFELRFDEAACFAQKADRRALVMTGEEGLIGVDRLRDALHRELCAAGIRSRRSYGKPHLTLLYDRFRSAAFRVRPLQWRVTDFALIRGVPRQPYEILGRWRLSDP